MISENRKKKYELDTAIKKKSSTVFIPLAAQVHITAHQSYF